MQFVETKNTIVVNAILDKKSDFTVEDIFEDVKDCLEKHIEDTDDMMRFISLRIKFLCELGLLSFTGLFYFVND